MDIPSTLGAPRHCYINGDVHWVRPMTMTGLAIVLNWLDDVLPGRADRKMPPKLKDDASQAALASFPGQTMLTWLALRDHGFSYAAAAELVPRLAEGQEETDETRRKAIEHFRILDVYMDRRRTRTRTEGGDDVADTWYEKNMALLAAQYGLEEIGNLTLDQYEWLDGEGGVDEFGQYDLQAINDEWRRNTLPMVRAAMEAGLAEEIPSTL